VAQEFGLTSVGVIMTGMGEDGAEGIGAIKSCGGMTLAQSEETCVVSGMPRAAIQRGYIQKVIPLDGLAAYLIQNYGTDRSTGEKADGSEKSEKQEKGEKVPISAQRG
jgi:two-component system chemotaxis response regulator CheB